MTGTPTLWHFSLPYSHLRPPPHTHTSTVALGTNRLRASGEGRMKGVPPDAPFPERGPYLPCLVVPGRPHLQDCLLLTSSRDHPTGIAISLKSFIKNNNKNRGNCLTLQLPEWYITAGAKKRHASFKGEAEGEIPQGSLASSHIFLGTWKAVHMPKAVHLLCKELRTPGTLTSGQSLGKK